MGNAEIGAAVAAWLDSKNEEDWIRNARELDRVLQATAVIRSPGENEFIDWAASHDPNVVLACRADDSWIQVDREGRVTEL